MRHHLPDAVTSAHFARLHTVDDTPILTRRELLKRVTMVGTAVAIPVRLVPIDGTPACRRASGCQYRSGSVRDADRGRGGDARGHRRAADPDRCATARARRRRARRTTSTARSAARWRRPARPIAAGSPPWTPTRAPRKGASFAQLSAADQDAVLRDMETQRRRPASRRRVDLLQPRARRTLQGTFGDPYYGGNANFVGWDLLGYPGRPSRRHRRASSGSTPTPAPTHMSAYDYTMFSKKPPRAGS